MATNMMIDLETLDTRPSAVVFQVGVLVFKDVLGGDIRGNIILEKKIFHLDLLEQIMAGRTIDPETVQWWRAQSADSWHRHPDEITRTGHMFQEINRLHEEHKVGSLWANSPSFDCVLMRSLRESLKIEWQFPSFREDMDLRTLKRLFQMKGRRMETSGKKTTHNALSDCEDQFHVAVHYLCEFSNMVELLEKMERDEVVPGLTKDT
ncbi:MAG TPA: 3'-5' exonuclease [Methanothrix soehngenii]|nr:3'-5' exonuclease [Methanothrix soehngenii]